LFRRVFEIVYANPTLTYRLMQFYAAEGKAKRMRDRGWKRKEELPEH
jgi:hypothetical protein